MKQILLIALIIATINCAAKDSCPIFKCSKTSPSADAGVCASRNLSGSTYTYTFNQCKSGYTCGGTGTALSALSATQTDAIAAAWMITGVNVNCQDMSAWEKLSGNVSKNFNTAVTAGKDLVGKSACDVITAASAGRMDGQDCKTNSNCFGTLECNSSKCAGLAKGSACTNDAHCDTGLACIDATCQNQRASGEACSTEWQCNNNLTCGDSKCVSYNSMADGSNVVSPNACKGKVSFPNTNGTYKCDSLVNVTNDCSGAADACSYKYSNAGNTVNYGCQCTGEFNALQERKCANPTPADKKTHNNVQTLLRYYSDINSCPDVKEVTTSMYGNCISSVFGSTAFIKSSILVILSVLAILF